MTFVAFACHYASRVFELEANKKGAKCHAARKPKGKGSFATTQRDNERRCESYRNLDTSG
jgi:hypothetical protein